MIDLGKAIKNTERKFGSVDVYYFSPVKLATGETVYALFTEREVTTAVKRAEGNLEDIAPLLVEEEIKQTRFGRFIHWITSFFGSTTRQ
jgi:hypothetical protein